MYLIQYSRLMLILKNCSVT